MSLPNRHQRSPAIEQFESRLALSALGIWPARDLLQLDNSTHSARDLGTLQDSRAIRREYVGPFDERDVFRFELAHEGDTAIRLHGMTSDADLYLLNEQREIIASSRNPGWRADAVQTRLAAGEYFVVVQNYDTWQSTQYSLDLTTQPRTLDPIGNTFATAKPLGSLRGTTTIADYVGIRDDKDVFQFTVDATSQLNIQLEELQADVDLHLYSRSGVKLATSNRPAAANEQIQAWIAQGEYFLVVDAYGAADSRYVLNLTSNLPARNPQVTNPTPAQPGQRPPIQDPPNGGSPNGDSPNGDSPNGDSPNVETPEQEPETPRTPDPSPGSSPVLETAPETSPSSPLANVPFFGTSSRDWGVNAVNAPEAWEAGYTGEGITVAIIDSGVQLNHPDLFHSIWVNADEIPGDGIDNDRNGYIDDVRGWDFIDQDNSPNDENGHGTHVAGIIAAANNSQGGTGVAYASSIMPIRTLDDTGSGSTQGVAQGIRYAVDNGAQVINLSLGGGNSQSVYSALRYAAENNVLVVAASGNENAQVPGYPAVHSASLSNVLSVGAYANTNRRASFSNRVGNSGAVQVDAPGQSVHSTYSGSRYTTLSGTSMATPFVSGVAALTWSANPSLDVTQLRNALTQSVAMAANGSDALGRINAAAAIPLAITGNIPSVSGSTIPAPSPHSFSNAQRMYALASWAHDHEEDALLPTQPWESPEIIEEVNLVMNAGRHANAAIPANSELAASVVDSAMASLASENS